jgi:limonene-1,2-epoxide hydrolase
MAPAAVSAVLAVTACTSGPSAATGGTNPTETVTTFMHALGDKNADAACAQVSTGGKPLADAGFDQCKEGLDKVLAELNDPSEIAKLKSATVTGATVSGDKATVGKAQITNVPEGYQNDIDLVRISGRWYIDSKP